MRLRVGLLIIVILTLMVSIPVKAQQDLVSMGINAGYDGYFREGFWMPLLISVTNNGDPIEGKLIARQERSTALTNSFSTPISIPSGGRQTVFLYITMKNFASTILVELLDAEDTIVTELEVPVRPVTPRDELYVVITGATNSAIDLTRLATGGNQAFQANWFPANIPDKVGTLDAVNMMIFSDVDTGTLTASQRNTIQEWVIAGGHLIVTGGINWQPTAAAFTDLLPLTPTGTTPVTDFAGLALLAGDYNNTLSGNYIVTSGQPVADAQVLASSSSDQPLLIRHTQGNGVVDYLTADPSIAPLRTWANQTRLWFSILTSLESRPGWTYGFNDLDKGIDSIEILPGFSALPEVTAMIGFLVLYIVLVGPVNYLILRRFNRRELAWITIPIFILLFSALAWATGFNLRGNEVTLSRVTVIQSWANEELARSEQLIGLLAPRRANYTLAMNDERLMRPITRTTQNSRFFSNTGGTIEVEQDNLFTALNFPVDASFIAAFATVGSLEAPSITGRATITYRGNSQSLRGTIRNDSDLTLSSAVILARGQVIRLEETLKPGDLYVFGEGDNELLLQTDGPASPAPIEYTPGAVYEAASRFYSPSYVQGVISYQQSLIDIIGFDNYLPYEFNYQSVEMQVSEEMQRRQKFLNAFMADEFHATGRGNRVYLVGWSDQSPFSENLTGVNWRAVDSTVYIIELETEIVPAAAGSTVMITPDQFTWVSLEREGILDAAPVNLTLYTDRIVSFRFTPLPDAVLSEINEMYLILDRGEVSGRYQTVNIELWDWRRQAWQQLEINDTRTPIPDASRYIGPLNAVQARIDRDLSGGYMYIAQLGVEQHGEF
ncbi:MAG: hypothetical protein H7X77_02090 [Anaerolineae bacterium]|nr:hypothetical protein [Anaerolineae bacterium]